jgi:hypothetical protein
MNMKKFITITGIVMCSLVASGQFAPGNLVVSRVGNGVTALSTAAAQVQLVEYTTAGSLTGIVVTLPTASGGAGNRACTNSGSSTSEGLITLSTDGRYLVHVGYDAPPGTADVAASTTDFNRVIARIDAAGAVNTSTSFTAAPGNAYVRNNIRGVVTEDGTAFWASGTSTTTTGGVRYITFGQDDVAGTQISTTITNTRSINIFNGQLYTSTQSGAIRLATVGTGLPTAAGQTITNLNGLPTTGFSAYGFVFFDRDPAVAGADLVYITCHSNIPADAGLYKYSFDGTTWTARGSLQTNAIVQSLAGFINCGGQAELFITRATVGTAVPTELRKFVDNAAYNANISNNGGDFTAAGVSTLLASAGANYAFRGICFSPGNSESVTGGILNLAGTFNNVTIKSGGFGIMTGNVSIAGKLTVENGGTLICNGFNVLSISGGAFDLQSGGSIQITSPGGITASGATGNIQTCSRSFSTGASYEYNGSAAQVTGNGLPAAVNDFTIDNAAGVTLSGPVTVNGNLNLQDGILNSTPTNLITQPATGTISSSASAYTNLPYSDFGGATSYVAGPYRKTGLSATALAIFPIGGAALHRPLFLRNVSGDFTVEYKQSNPRAVYGTARAAGIDHVSAVEYWLISASGGPAGVVELSFYDPNSGGVTNMADLRVGRWDGSQWISEGNNGTAGTPGTNGSVTSNVVSGFSPGVFTLASSTPNNPLPLKNIQLTAVPVAQQARLQWLVNSDNDVADYVIEQSGDGLLFEAVKTIPASRSNIAVTYVHSVPLPGSPQHYRIKARLQNGQAAYSNIVVLTGDAQKIIIYPNPVRSQLRVLAGTGGGSYQVLGSNGAVVLNGRLTVTVPTIYTSGLAAGVYYLKITDARGAVTGQVFVKE